MSGKHPWDANEGKFDTPSSSVPKAGNRELAAELFPEEQAAFAYRGIEPIGAADGEVSDVEAVEIALKPAPEPLKGERIESHEVKLLRSIVERIENINEQITDLQGERRDVKASAKTLKFDTAVIDMIIRRRKLDQSVREDQDAMLELYEEALGMRPGAGAGALDAARDARLISSDVAAPAIAKKKPTVKDLAIAEAIGWASSPTRH